MKTFSGRYRSAAMSADPGRANNGSKPGLEEARAGVGGHAEWAWLIGSCIASGCFTLGVDEAWAGPLGLTLLAAAGAGISRLEPTHPYMWFGVPYWLYSVSMPILVGMGATADSPSLKEALALEWVGLASFLVVLGPSRPTGSMPSEARAWRPAPRLPTIGLFGISLALSALFVGEAISGNYSSKLDILLSGAPSLTLSFSFSVFAFAYGVLLAGSLVRGRVPRGLIAFTALWTGFSYLVAGERDFLVRVAVITVLVFCAVRRIPARRVVVVAALGILLLPFMGEFKGVLLHGELPELVIENLPAYVLRDEFITPTRNLTVLLDGSDRWSPFYGETLAWSVFRIFVPGTLFPDAGRTATGWFNELFYATRVAQGGGVGFSLVGEGYANFGPVGVIGWFAALAAFVRFLWNRSGETVLWLVVYATTATLVVYVIRADAANLLAQFTRHIALPAAAISLCGRLSVGGPMRPLREAKGELEWTGRI